MRRAVLLGPLACVVLTFGCQTVPDPSLIRERIAHTKSWHLVSSSRLEPGDTPGFQELSYSSTMSVPKGPLTSQPERVQFNIRIANRTSHMLKEKYGIALTEDTSGASGEIRITLRESLSGALESVDVALYDVGKQLITRAVVWNNTEDPTYTRDDRRYYSSFNESFADNIAGKTAALLRGGGMVTQ